MTPGVEDSRTNRSSIVNSTVQLPPYPYGDASWSEVVRCVRNMFEPFDVEITDVDPGSTPHFEAMVAGSPQDAGFANDVGGVAPATCGVIGNAINFTFAEVWGDDPQRICEVIAQETGHTFGMDHEYLCADPMTYLTGCGAKTFQDVDAQCGEYEPRACKCGGATQNSVQRLLYVFGAGEPTPPTVEIVEPADGATVRPGFTVSVDASDNHEVTEVSLVVGGQPSGTLTTRPYVFNTPDGLADGPVTIEARAVDNRGDAAVARITVVLDSSCRGDSDCGPGQMCDGGACVDRPPGEGELGDPCEGNADCRSGMCARSGDEQRCTAACDPTVADACPAGFDCLSAGTGGACWPAGGDGTGGGCAVRSGGTSAPATWALIAAVGALAVRRRRR
ncbi:MAG: hypothetical protein D6689_03655 [Deltaproteobacteria bacterium]|nr:MAG: hypothetical protein D6689_03655 [Deltaproteobacteria bacterium]